MAVAGAAGCFLSKTEEVDSSPDQVTGGGDVSAVLKSTLVLQAGCTATKIGPQHLLIAARCVAGNDAFAVGNTLKYTVASAGGTPVPAADAGASKDAGAASDNSAGDSDGGDTDTDTDAGAGAGDGTGTGATDTGAAGSTKNAAHSAVIADVQVHPSFTAKCKGSACGFGTTEAGDAPDVAVILLKDALDTVPSVPVDLDPVGDADPLLVVSSGCSRMDASSGKVQTTKTMAVPAKAVEHAGSAYASAPQLVTRFGSAYVVTPGSGWQGTAARVCMGDMGAPVFRGGTAAVAGVMSNFTTRSADKMVPITVHHARVDGATRFKIGVWLQSLGADTIHSCSESSAGCPKLTYSGSMPDDKGPTGDITKDDGDGGKSDASVDGSAGDDGTGNSEQPVQPDDPSADNGDDGTGDDYADAAVAPKKTKKTTGGCSAAPGSAPAGELGLGLGLALAAVVARRRRR